ncbi:MAG: hypothetical protein P8Z50_01965 [candidate division WOR-3 bacterium]
MESARIKGAYVEFAEKLELNLYGFDRFAVDEKILDPKYNYKNDENLYFCDDCKGRFEIFVPYCKMSRIIFKKNQIAEIHLKDNHKPIYAYVYEIDITGEEDLAGFGKGDFEAKLHLEGDEIIFPDLIKSRIEEVSDISAIVLLNNGMERQLSDFRPRTLILKSGDNEIKLPVKKIKTIQVINPSNCLCLVRLRTGEEREFLIKWNDIGFAGIAGKGEHWYEQMAWKDIESIRFK